MKNCTKCNTANRDTAKFCITCGELIDGGLLCPRCGTANSSTARFCRGCSCPLSQAGSAFVPPPPPSAGFVKTGMIPKNTLVGGRYLICGKIGQGGMGAVYKVSDSRLGNIICAMKEMSSSAILDPVEKNKAQSAFQREAQLLGTLSHPNLPRVTDYFSDGDKQFLVMDYIEGQTLDELLTAASHPIAQDRVIEWARQMCDVLHYLHTRKTPIIFRDLKPGNIMIPNDCDDLKLIDFGIARFFKPGAKKDTMALGTPGYAPPEQYGKYQSDERSDVYALGATLHQILTLRDPSIEPFKFPSISIYNPSVAPHIENAIMRAVEQNQSKRWQTIREMGDAITGKAGSPSYLTMEQAIPATLFVKQPAASMASAGHVAGPSIASSVIPFQSQTVHAGLIPRFAAYFMDWIFISLLAIPLVILIANNLYYEDEIYLYTAVSISILAVAYYTILHSIGGQSWGKKLAGIKVVCGDGSKMGFGRALWRSILFPLITLILIPFGVGLLFYLWPLFHSRNRGLHDLLAGTLVIKV